MHLFSLSVDDEKILSSYMENSKLQLFYQETNTTDKALDKLKSLSGKINKTLLGAVHIGTMDETFSEKSLSQMEAGVNGFST